jgi:predicted nucleic acid-binding protein
MDRGVIVADTDVLVDVIAQAGAHAQVAALFRAGRLATTAVTVFEMWRGARSDLEQESTRRALRGVRVYALTDAAAKRAAEVHRGLKTNPIGERDMLIASVCLAIGRPLLTRKVRHFRRVPGLEVVQAR